MKPVNQGGENEGSSELPTGRNIARCNIHKKGSLLNPVKFEEVALGSTEVFIEFNSQLYRLSRTRAGKLILTKAIGDSLDQ